MRLDFKSTEESQDSDGAVFTIRDIPLEEQQSN